MEGWQIDKTQELLNDWLGHMLKKSGTPRPQDVELLDKIVRLKLKLQAAHPPLPIFGVDAGLCGAGVFSAADYLGRHRDLRESLGSHNYAAALEHWLQEGLDEGRQACPAFSARWYLSENPDLRETFGDDGWRKAAEHWLQTGMREGRQGCAGFSAPEYINLHSDLEAAFGKEGYAEAVVHWVRHGVHETRQGRAG